MAETPTNKTSGSMKALVNSRYALVDEDAKQDWLKKKADKKYKAQVRKYRREAENDTGELNLTAMMDMMTILLVFLLKSYGAADINVVMGPDLTPPSSKSLLMPVQAVTLTITKKDIAVGEKGVLELENGRLPASAFASAQSPLIPKIKDALIKELDKQVKIASNNAGMQAKMGTEKDPTRMLTIVGDKDMPYETLFKVLGTAGQACDSGDQGICLKYFKFLVISSSS
jgi:biopolymer transport protein ExbD